MQNSLFLPCFLQFGAASSQRYHGGITSSSQHDHARSAAREIPEMARRVVHNDVCIDESRRPAGLIDAYIVVYSPEPQSGTYPCRPRAPRSVATRSDHSIIPALSQQYRIIIAALSQHYRSIIAAVLLHYHDTITALSQHHHSIITA